MYTQMYAEIFVGGGGGKGLFIDLYYVSTQDFIKCARAQVPLILREYQFFQTCGVPLVITSSYLINPCRACSGWTSRLMFQNSH